jgi:hypothetical protein
MTGSPQALGTRHSTNRPTNQPAFLSQVLVASLTRLSLSLSLGRLSVMFVRSLNYFPSLMNYAQGNLASPKMKTDKVRP